MNQSNSQSMLASFLETMRPISSVYGSGDPRADLYILLTAISILSLITYFFAKSKRKNARLNDCLLYTSPSPRDATLSRMPSSA